MNHEKTVQSIKQIEKILREIKAIQDKTNEDIKKISSDIPAKMLHPDYAAAQITETKRAAEYRIAPLCEKIYGFIEDIHAAEAELSGSTVDLSDATLVTAVQLVQSLGKDMPIEQQQRIAAQFRGNYPAEAVLSDLYKKLGLVHVVKHTNFTQLCFNLRTAVNAFASQPMKIPAAFHKVEKALNDILESVQSDYRVDLGVAMLAFMDGVAAAAGCSFLYDI